VDLNENVGGDFGWVEITRGSERGRGLSEEGGYLENQPRMLWVRSATSLRLLLSLVKWLMFSSGLHSRNKQLSTAPPPGLSGAIAQPSHFLPPGPLPSSPPLRPPLFLRFLLQPFLLVCIIFVSFFFQLSSGYSGRSKDGDGRRRRWWGHDGEGERKGEGVGGV
jgi:hypothetical protein